MKTLLGVLCVMVVAACGDGESSSDAFIGTWTYNPGSTTTIDCPDNSLDNTDAETGSFQITEGVSSDLISVPQSGDPCPAVRYDVNGSVATIQPAQTCMYVENTAGGPVTVMAAYATGSFTLSADKRNVTGSASGSVVLTGTGATTTCSLTGSLSANKAGN